MSDLIATFTAYFAHFRAHHPDVDMVFTGCAPYQEEAEAHADENGWTIVDCGCCSDCTGKHPRDETISAYDFEDTLINTHKPSVSLPALEAAATAAGCHVVTHRGPWSLNDDGYEQHSIVFHPGPEGWIEELYKSIAVGKLVGAAPTGLDHSVYRTTTITYPGIYAKAVNELILEVRDHDEKISSKREFFDRRKLWLEYAKWDVAWLLDYRQRSQKDLSFTFEYETYSCLEMGCQKCTAVMGEDTITYQCHCPAPTFESIDAELEDTLKYLK
jgi:hypothetical protein